MIYPSLVKIRSFIAVAEQSSFRKAAESLHISQPALSAHIRNLESDLGVPLLSRTTRSVKVTKEGQRFLIGAKRALSELESVMLELKEEAALQRGLVTVGSVPTIASSVLPTILAVFTKRYPHVKVQVLDEVAEAVQQRVLSGQADLGIGPAPRRESEIQFAKIVRDHFIAVFPSNHELARRKWVRVQDLAKYPILTLALDSNVGGILHRAFARAGQTLDPVYELHHHYTLGSMVEAGLGVTALPSMSLSLLGHARLRSARMRDPELHRDIGVLTRRGAALSPAAAEFLKTALAVFAASEASQGASLITYSA